MAVRAREFPHFRRWASDIGVAFFHVAHQLYRRLRLQGQRQQRSAPRRREGEPGRERVGGWMPGGGRPAAAIHHSKMETAP